MWFEKLIQIKKQTGKTTDEISALSGIPKGTLNKIFAGVTKDPQLETIKAILYSLGYSLKDLDETSQKKSSAETEDGRLNKIIEIYNDINEAGQDSLYDQAIMHSKNEKFKKYNSVTETA